MRPIPLYTPEMLRGPACQLRYGWTGWSSEPAAPVDLDTLFGLLDPAWGNGRFAPSCGTEPTCKTSPMTISAKKLTATGCSPGAAKPKLGERLVGLDSLTCGDFGSHRVHRSDDVVDFVVKQVADEQIGQMAF